MNRKKVLIVDDSAVVRQVIGSILSSAPDLEVVAAVADPLYAMERMKKTWPDVIVLDVEMPRMDGITFLRKIMSEHPTPVVVCSTLTEKGTETTMQALSAGAVGIIAKPKIGLKQSLQDEAAFFIESVRGAARANMKCIRRPAAAAGLPKVEAKLSADVILPPGGHAMAQTTDGIVAIGTSTGGTQALEVVLSSLPRVSPGIVVVQHMPEKFTAAFAARLNSVCEMEVREAANNDRVIPGRVLIAPGGRHMMLKRSGAQYHVEVVDGPVVNRHRPSVDVLFRSVAKCAGSNALGIIMTGMGDDGARGMTELHGTGAHTVAQDEDSCVVFGMPKEAIKLGGVDEIMPLGRIAQSIRTFAAQHR